VRYTTRAECQDDEALRVAAPLDHLHAQPRYLCQRSVNLSGVVGGDRFPDTVTVELVKDVDDLEIQRKKAQH
jgi:hypothetical protein